MKNPTTLNNASRWIAAALIAMGAAGARAQDGAAPTEMPAMEHGSTEHGAMPGMDHGPAPGQGVASTQPSELRDPNAYSDGYGFGPLARPRMGDERAFGSVLVDRLERAFSDDGASTSYDLEAWYGRDYDRAVLEAEGEASAGKLQDARTELLWGHAIAAFWDTQLGVRYDSGEGPERRWLAFGVQGLAPYWFDVEASAYVGEEGRSALRFAARYELLLTQRLVLEPRVEANAYGKSDPQRELGAGLSNITAGLRLRYEIRRELAPYVGIERAAELGGTADLASAAGNPTRETRLLVGVRFWF